MCPKSVPFFLQISFSSIFMLAEGQAQSKKSKNIANNLKTGGRFYRFPMDVDSYFLPPRHPKDRCNALQLSVDSVSWGDIAVGRSFQAIYPKKVDESLPFSSATSRFWTLSLSAPTSRPYLSVVLRPLCKLSCPREVQFSVGEM